jgi:hypothetical protein
LPSTLCGDTFLFTTPWLPSLGNIVIERVVCIIGVVGKTETTDFPVRSVPWWRWVLVSVLMFSLVVTVATRTFHVAVPHSATVQSNSPQAMRQHMDRDAVRWVAPIAKIVAVTFPTFYPRVALVGPTLPTLLLLEDSLYNRPPPTC